MHGFIRPNRLVAFLDADQQVCPRGYGHSSTVTNGKSARRNSWLMTNGLINPSNMNVEPTISLGLKQAFSSTIGGTPIGASTQVNRKRFLSEMRGLKGKMSADAKAKTCYLESNLRAFGQIPDFTQDWPEPPSLNHLIPPDDPSIQIDIGTIGILAPLAGSKAFTHVGEVFSFRHDEYFKEVWVVSEKYQERMPPGETTAPWSMMLVKSRVFSTRKPEDASDFASEARKILGPDISVFLVHAAASSEIPTEPD